ncbi:sulfate transporter CysZ [Plasticicumulans acidivorans]|uniref:sulfate transporter CysZ n=1 Tax=Plasticicumulans acidivorans TaxID=886464 RepID=UPI000D7136BA|nr:sulfate transporter CysZ [Plasticicumulans acidivorans]
MIGPFARGAGCAFSGLRLLTHPQLRSFVLIPLLINVVLFGGGLWWGGGELSAFLDAQIARLPDWLSWLHWLIVPLVAVAAAAVFFYGFSIVANLVGAPFNGYLAARVEQMRCPGTQHPQRPLWQEVTAAFASAIGSLVYFVAWTIPFLLLFFIPGVNLLAPLLWAAFSAWMLALQYLDYPLGNHGISFREQRRLHAQDRLRTFGFGCGVLLLTFIPGLNLLAMPAAVIGATLLHCERSAAR